MTGTGSSPMTDSAPRTCKHCLSNGHPLNKPPGTPMNDARKGGTECASCRKFRAKKTSGPRPTCKDCKDKGHPLNKPPGTPMNNARPEGSDCGSCHKFKKKIKKKMLPAVQVATAHDVSPLPLLPLHPHVIPRPCRQQQADETPTTAARAAAPSGATPPPPIPPQSQGRIVSSLSPGRPRADVGPPFCCLE